MFADVLQGFLGKWALCVKVFLVSGARLLTASGEDVNVSEALTLGYGEAASCTIALANITETPVSSTVKGAEGPFC